jgi:hypothetical protein
MRASAARQSARVPAECHPCSSHETSSPPGGPVLSVLPGVINLAHSRVSRHHKGLVIFVVLAITLDTLTPGGDSPRARVDRSPSRQGR